MRLDFSLFPVFNYLHSWVSVTWSGYRPHFGRGGACVGQWRLCAAPLLRRTACGCCQYSFSPLLSHLSIRTSSQSIRFIRLLSSRISDCLSLWGPQTLYRKLGASTLAWRRAASPEDSGWTWKWSWICWNWGLFLCLYWRIVILFVGLFSAWRRFYPSWEVGVSGCYTSVCCQLFGVELPGILNWALLRARTELWTIWGSNLTALRQRSGTFA